MYLRQLFRIFDNNLVIDFRTNPTALESHKMIMGIINDLFLCFKTLVVDFCFACVSEPMLKFRYANCLSHPFSGDKRSSSRIQIEPRLLYLSTSRKRLYKCPQNCVLFLFLFISRGQPTVQSAEWEEDTCPILFATQR